MLSSIALFITLKYTYWYKQSPPTKEKRYDLSWATSGRDTAWRPVQRTKGIRRIHRHYYHQLKTLDPRHVIFFLLSFQRKWSMQIPSQQFIIKTTPKRLPRALSSNQMPTCFRGAECFDFVGTNWATSAHNAFYCMHKWILRRIVTYFLLSQASVAHLPRFTCIWMHFNVYICVNLHKSTPCTVCTICKPKIIKYGEKSLHKFTLDLEWM
jgi:hypothetical protein